MTGFSFFLDWELTCQFAGLIWAREEGLYARAGLDVALVPPHENPDKTVLDLVLENECCAGCVEDNLLIHAALAGRDVRAIGAMLQETPLVLMTARNSGIKTIADLAGRKVAMHADGIRLLQVVLALHNVDPHTVECEVGGWSLDDLVAGRYDAVQGYAITEAVELDRAGFAARLIPIRHRDLNPQSEVIVATTTCMARHGDVLQRFMDASLAGWQQAMSQRDRAAAMMADVCEAHDDPVVNKAILDAMVPFVAGTDGSAQVGALGRERWRRKLETYARFGMVDRLADFGEVADERFL